VRRVQVDLAKAGAEGHAAAQQVEVAADDGDRHVAEQVGAAQRVRERAGGPGLPAELRLGDAARPQQGADGVGFASSARRDHDSVRVPGPEGGGGLRAPHEGGGGAPVGVDAGAGDDDGLDRPCHALTPAPEHRRGGQREQRACPDQDGVQRALPVGTISRGSTR
jgi:hypothetical protein